MKKDFFDRLYKGYSAENFIAAQLFEHGFEAFRLPADFGIDLVVTNQFKRLEKQGVDDDSFPFGFQVKSRRLRESDTKPGPNGRNEYQFEYSLKYDEIKTLQSFSNSAYAFVFILPFGLSIRNIYAFCIHSRYIPGMIQEILLIHDDYNQRYLLKVRFRTFPQQSRNSLIKEMQKQGIISPDGVKFLETQLPEMIPRNWLADEYLDLGKDMAGNNMTIKSYDFSKFPFFSPPEQFQDY